MHTMQHGEGIASFILNLCGQMEMSGKLHILRKELPVPTEI